MTDPDTASTDSFFTIVAEALTYPGSTAHMGHVERVVAAVRAHQNTLMRHAAAQALRDAADTILSDVYAVNNWPDAPHNCAAHDEAIAEWLRARADTLNTPTDGAT